MPFFVANIILLCYDEGRREEINNLKNKLMEDFKLNTGERVLVDFHDAQVFANENQYKIELLLVTNERILLFYDSNKEIDFVNMFRARGMGLESKYELLTEFKLNSIKNIEYKEQMNHITFRDNDNTLDIFGENLNNYLDEL